MSFLLCEHRAGNPAVFLIALVICVSCDSSGQSMHKSALPADPLTRNSRDQVRSRLLTLELPAADPPALSADAVIQKLMATSARRSSQLRGYRATRLYHIQYHGIFGAREASIKVIATYTAPDKHDFSVVSESGSKLLINRILLKLLDSEREAYRNQSQIEISPANYRFESLGTERMPDGRFCYILGVRPKQETKFLYRGKIWVDAQDFAVVQMEGQPARSPSFWIKDTQIDSNWEKVGSFWLIGHNKSVSRIRMGGSATLTVDYADYEITGVGRTQGRGQSPQLPDPSSVTPQR